MNDPQRYKRLPLVKADQVACNGFRVISGELDSKARIGHAFLRASETIRTYERLLREAGITHPQRTD